MPGTPEGVDVSGPRSIGTGVGIPGHTSLLRGIPEGRRYTRGRGYTRGGWIYQRGMDIPEGRAGTLEGTGIAEDGVGMYTHAPPATDT